jgi:hypothetical protein
MVGYPEFKLVRSEGERYGFYPDRDAFQDMEGCLVENIDGVRRGVGYEDEFLGGEDRLELWAEEERVTCGSRFDRSRLRGAAGDVWVQICTQCLQEGNAADRGREEPAVK